MQKKILMGEKIRDFAELRFGNLSKLADYLNMKPQSLQKYLNGDRIPGGEILKKLLKAGCDLNWLLSESVQKIELNTGSDFMFDRNVNKNIKVSIDQLIKDNDKIKSKLFDLIVQNEEFEKKFLIIEKKLDKLK